MIFEMNIYADDDLIYIKKKYQTQLFVLIHINTKQ